MLGDDHHDLGSYDDDDVQEVAAPLRLAVRSAPSVSQTMCPMRCMRCGGLGVIQMIAISWTPGEGGGW